jgi:hypothetical protein
VRVNARLVDASTGAHLWAEQIDADQSALATSQDNSGIASPLARALSVGLVKVEGRRAPHGIGCATMIAAGRRVVGRGVSARYLISAMRWSSGPCARASVANAPDACLCARDLP